MQSQTDIYVLCSAARMGRAKDQARTQTKAVSGVQKVVF
jgi:hypothetical protein